MPEKRNNILDRARPAGTRATSGPLIGSHTGQISDPAARTRPAPLYQQVKDYIVERIRSNQWPIDSRVPSENRLVETLGVSKMTVNRALRELTTEGALIRIQGLGTFVAPPEPVSTLLEIKPIAEEIAQRGGNHSSQVRVHARETAPPDLALALALPAGAEVFHTVIVHSDDGVPIQLEDRYVNPAEAPGFLDQDFNTTTPSRYLLDVVPLTEAEHVIEAMLPDERLQKLLDIGPNEPCLVLYRRTWSHEAVVTRSRFIHPASRFRLGGRFRPSSPVQSLEA